MRLPDHPRRRGGRVRSRPLYVIMRLVALTAVAGVLLFGVTAGASTNAKAPKKGGTFTFLFNTEPPGADVLQLREIPNISPALMAGAIYDQLIWVDPANLKVQPGIATSVTTT